ncbi:methyl-accepting chemotaxis protein [Bacillus sp. FJAT-42376]|uniref:methyl-accepting chemotaxis protein n=1 Tax=Bacillus sp. FJAT-42376 TaxID=2014076 RepID=UPI000F506092|nr:methyl-accepting chemotaxis protein [Bacillus sp. FJAT-42376]AZB44530.1 methyl-accepting chemotaxis protein [Bacillus sp. FJAT-42376]
MNKLSSKIAVLLTIGMFIVLAGNILMIYFSTQKSVESSIRNFSMNLSDNISSKMDRERYSKFIHSPKENNDYWKLREELNDFREKSGALYVYTLMAKSNKLYVMIDGQPRDEKKASPLIELSSTTSYKDIRSVLSGNHSSSPIVKDPKYGNYLSAFSPIIHEGKVVGILGVDIDAKNVHLITKNVLKEQLPIFITGNALLIAFMIFLLIILIRNRLKPLAIIQQASEQIAEGNLKDGQKILDLIKIKGQDEIEQVSKSYKEMIDKNIEMIKEVQGSAQSLLASSKEIEDKMTEMTLSNTQVMEGIREVASGSDIQLARTEDSAQAMEDLAEGIQMIAETSNTVSDQSSALAIEAENGAIEMQNIVRQTEFIKSSVRQSSDIMKGLGIQANEISGIVSVITDIAEQTNLLALNAAIESARAGEQGKGFAVVSQEVRKLAESSKASAEQIRQKLTSFKLTIEEAVKEMEEGTNLVQNNTQTVLEAEETFNKLLESVETVAKNIQAVSGTTQEMSANTEEISGAFEENSILSKETALITAKVAESTDKQEEIADHVYRLTVSLSSLSKKLEESIVKFVI